MGVLIISWPKLTLFSAGAQMDQRQDNRLARLVGEYTRGLAQAQRFFARGQGYVYLRALGVEPPARERLPPVQGDSFGSSRFSCI